jgi:hypothetical protein
MTPASQEGEVILALPPAHNPNRFTLIFYFYGQEMDRQ